MRLSMLPSRQQTCMQPATIVAPRSQYLTSPSEQRLHQNETERFVVDSQRQRHEATVTTTALAGVFDIAR